MRWRVILLVVMAAIVVVGILISDWLVSTIPQAPLVESQPVSKPLFDLFGFELWINPPSPHVRRMIALTAPPWFLVLCALIALIAFWRVIRRSRQSPSGPEVNEE
jgi:hypothetical protein